VPGTLRRDRVLAFAGYMAMYCHEVVSRSLALSILERTLEVDLPLIRDCSDAERKAGEAHPSAAKQDEESSASPPATRGQKLRSETEDTARSSDDMAETAIISPPRKPDRLWQFLAAGGLKIIDQWVQDASRDVPNPSLPPGTKHASNKESSPTGALLLPLLILLRDLPFDKHLVKQSKIIRSIRSLSNDIDALVASVDKAKSRDTRHPRAGGYSIREVQRVLDDLKASWNAQQKNHKDAPESIPNPFDPVQAALLSKLQEMKQYQNGEISQPPWLRRAWEEKEVAEPRPKKGRHMSTEEISRIDHQRERSLRIKQDLQKAEQERQEYQKRLRQIRLRHADQQKQAAAFSLAAADVRRRKVRWKDGIGFEAVARCRADLEEVFVFPNDASFSSSSAELDSDARSQEGMEDKDARSQEEMEDKELEEMFADVDP
jgi:hypothetical protein